MAGSNSWAAEVEKFKEEVRARKEVAEQNTIYVESPPKEFVPRWQRKKPEHLRNHPRWCPTNEPQDLNCAMLFLPSWKYARSKHLYDWLIDRSSYGSAEDRENYLAYQAYGGTFRSCMQIKFMASYQKGKNILIKRFGPDEPWNSDFYVDKHHFKFRKKPPPEFINPNIPDERYEQLKGGNIGLSRGEKDDLVYNVKKFGKHYRICVIRGKMKAFLVENWPTWEKHAISAYDKLRSLAEDFRSKEHGINETQSAGS